MKAFLMYPDRDFDPTRLLVRRERELRYSRRSDKGGKNEELSLKPILPWNEAALRQDLGLDILFGAMCQSDIFLKEVAQLAVLRSLTNITEIRYRQDVLADSMANPSAIRDIYALAIEAIESERKNYWGFTRYPAGVLHSAVDVLQPFVDVLKRLRAVADQSKGRFKSEGFVRFFSMLKTELSDEYFKVIEQHLSRLKFRRGTLISAQLGKGNKGRNYVLRRPQQDKRNWLRRLLGERPEGYTFQLHPRDENGARALSALNDRGVNLVANALAQSTDHILSFFQMLKTELAFYIGCLNLHSQLEQFGEPMCFPKATAIGDGTLSFSNLYDVSLALSVGRKVVGNDFDIDRRKILIITGANTGGKSTFLRSLGLAMLMMQAGMFVPAEMFSSEICDGLLTHYKREEDTAMESGKWDEELSRMSAIVDNVKPYSMVLFNESFASTNEREGSEIAGQIVNALLGRDVRVVFVTHLYHFARSFLREEAARAAFLRAERRPDGTRPYKLVEGEPLQTSYGEDLYKIVFSNTVERRASA